MVKYSCNYTEKLLEILFSPEEIVWQSICFRRHIESVFFTVSFLGNFLICLRRKEIFILKKGVWTRTPVAAFTKVNINVMAITVEKKSVDTETQNFWSYNNMRLTFSKRKMKMRSVFIQWVYYILLNPEQHDSLIGVCSRMQIMLQEDGIYSIKKKQLS